MSTHHDIAYHARALASSGEAIARAVEQRLTGRPPIDDEIAHHIGHMRSILQHARELEPLLAPFMPEASK